MPDDTTPHLGLPLPHPDHLLSEDVLRLRTALSGVDAQMTQVDATLADLHRQVQRLRLSQLLDLSI